MSTEITFGGGEKSLIVLIIVAGIVAGIVTIVVGLCIADQFRAQEQTVQVCLQQGLDPECCRYPHTCEEHE